MYFFLLLCSLNTELYLWRMYCHFLHSSVIASLQSSFIFKMRCDDAEDGVRLVFLLLLGPILIALFSYQILSEDSHPVSSGGFH